MNRHIEKAIRIYGSQSALAAAIGFSQVAVSNWLRNKKRIRAEAAVAIQQATNGKVSCRELRPDIFGPTEDEIPYLPDTPGIELASPMASSPSASDRSDRP